MFQVWALALFLTAIGAYTYFAARRYERPEAEAERNARKAKLAELAAFKKRMAANVDKSQK